MEEVGLSEVFLAGDLNDDKTTRTSHDYFMRCEWEFRYPEVVKERMKPLWLHRAKNPSHMKARLLILAEALASFKGNGWTSYPRNEKKYKDLKRYCGPDFKFEPIIAEIDELSSPRFGLLEHIKMPPLSHRDPVPMQSMFRATSKLRELLGDLELVFVYHDVIRKRALFNANTNEMVFSKIRGRSYYRKLVNYKDTDDTNIMRAEIQLINEFLRTIKLEWKTVVVNRSSRYKKFDKHGVLTTPLFVTRSFCRDNFDLYGRVHGFWQNQRKGIRKDIRLNDMETCEPDYSQMHVNIPYCEKGLTPPENAYFIEGYNDKKIKSAFPIIFNASTPEAAAGALAAKLRNKDKHLDNKASMKEAHEIINRIKTDHTDIQEYFHSDRGIELMKIESDIAIRVMLKCVEERIEFLPIHDGFRVPRSKGERAKEIMIDCFQQKYPKFRCKVKL